MVFNLSTYNLSNKNTLTHPPLNLSSFNPLKYDYASKYVVCKL